MVNNYYSLCCLLQANNCSAHTLNNINNNQATMTEKKVESKASNSGRPDWKANTKGYKDCVFYCGKRCAEDFVGTSRELIDYIRTTHGVDALRFMLKDKISIEGMSKPHKYTSKEDMENALTYTQQVSYIDTTKIYNKKKNAVEYALGEILSLLYAHCHLTMRNKLAVDPEYQKMASKDGATMYRLIFKISNGANVIQNPILQFVDAMFTFIYIRGGDYNLQQYYETFHNWRKNAEKLGCFFGSETLKILVMDECVSRKDTGSDLYLLLFEWKKATTDRPTSMDDASWADQDL